MHLLQNNAHAKKSAYLSTVLILLLFCINNIASASSDKTPAPNNDQSAKMTACQRYQKLILGSAFASARKQLGQPKHLQIRRITNYTWTRNNYQFNASFANDKFSYSSYLGFQAHGPPPQVFIEANKYRPNTITDLNKLLGRPTTTRKIINKIYRFVLPGEIWLQLSTDQNGKITGKSISLVCTE